MTTEKKDSVNNIETMFKSNYYQACKSTYSYDLQILNVVYCTRAHIICCRWSFANHHILVIVLDIPW